MSVFFACLVALVLNLSHRLPLWLTPKTYVIGWAQRLEAHFNTPAGRAWRSHGATAWLIVITPFVALLWLAEQLPYLGWVIDVLVLCWALELGSIKTRVIALIAALKNDDLTAAKQQLEPVVAQRLDALDQQGVAKVSTEWVLKDGVYTVLAVLFWFVIFGPMGAAIYRLSHGLNRLWGHRDQRFIRFGWASAKLFEALAFIPTRVAAFSFALLGKTRLAFACWREQASLWPSPNAGVILASGAGALNVRLGGPAQYASWEEPRCDLGGEHAPNAVSLDHALNLVYQSIGLWLLLIGLWMFF